MTTGGPTMAERKEDILRPHTFDGIEEYDNALPMWWQVLFVLSIVFAVAYVGLYHFGPGRVGIAAYEHDVKGQQEALLALEGDAPSESTLRGLLGDEERIAAGEELYHSAKGQCVQCHGQDGLGVIGPSLRDDLWKYGNDLTEIIDVIAKGRAGNQMPARQGTLSPSQIQNLALFVVNWNKTAKANDQGKHIEGEVPDPIDY